MTNGAENISMPGRHFRGANRPLPDTKRILTPEGGKGREGKGRAGIVGPCVRQSCGTVNWRDRGGKEGPGALCDPKKFRWLIARRDRLKRALEHHSSARFPSFVRLNDSRFHRDGKTSRGIMAAGNHLCHRRCQNWAISAYY